jgi:hypothetical protein
LSHPVRAHAPVGIGQLFFLAQEAVQQQQAHADGDGRVGDVEHPREVQARDVDEVDDIAVADAVDQVVAERPADDQADSRRHQRLDRLARPDRQADHHGGREDRQHPAAELRPRNRPKLMP